ncbi:hypothetical protein PCL1606_22250 [Pseudomonas chlororaphis]|uniref:Uncharacterized protein n=1 Tax=Pseudomonas chlororaphis TaxID=587753 RepID=A0A0D5XX73_9PSED|nr:hypothetical protein PCL1606_22250 [Pseudomonas chlororaphis]
MLCAGYWADASVDSHHTSRKIASQAKARERQGVTRQDHTRSAPK